ncbi:MAG: hypothetical protein WDO56_29595 [Gammaproteobacteria bacterium]
MFLDIHYTDDGFIVEALLVNAAERALNDRQLVRQVCWPDKIYWVVAPVAARLREHALPDVADDRSWSVTREGARPAAIERARQRLRAALTTGDRVDAADKRELESLFTDTQEWIGVTVHFFETGP